MLTDNRLTAIIERMVYIKRQIERNIQDALERNKSVLLFGARQTGKTTLIEQIQADIRISFAKPEVRHQYDKNPSLLSNRVEALDKNKDHLPLIIIDEAQKVPEIFDAVQDLIDRKAGKFILTGSSTRKLKQHHKLNLLPGRVVVLTLMPLTIAELPKEKRILENLLNFGSLPGIITIENNIARDIDLHSYVITYLEEEIRAEAAVKNVTFFSRFLELAAAESGKMINFNKLSQEIGVARTTIASYYQILEDCLIAERVAPFTHSKTRRRLIKTPKYLFFDLGIRRLAAEEGTKPSLECLGTLFEQYIGLELIRLSKLNYERNKVYFWRDANGPEIDWIISKDDQLIPIEVKWTNNPNLYDARHLQVFCDETKETQNAYIICRTPHKIKLANKIFALPWQDIDKLVNA